MRVLPTTLPTYFQVPAREFEGLRIGQKARYTDIRIHQSAAGECAVHLHLEVTQCQWQPDGTLGDPLPARHYPPHPVVLVADNNTAVTITADPADPAFGALRYIKLQDATDTAAGQLLNVATGQVEPLPPRPDGNAWHLFVEQHPEPLALQGDAFKELMKYPQVLDDLVAKHVAAAAPMGRFA